MFPLFTTRCLHVRHDVRDPSGGSGKLGENVILPKWRLPRHLGIFYMPQIYDMGPTALLSLRRKACWGFFSPLKIRRLRPGLNLRTWVLKASTLPLDHRSHWKDYVNEKFQWHHRESNLWPSGLYRCLNQLRHRVPPTVDIDLFIFGIRKNKLHQDRYLITETASLNKLQ